MARIHIDIELRWGDQDAYGHINNVAYARYLEEARVRVFFTGATREKAGLEKLFRDDRPDGQKMVVASQHIEFIHALNYSNDPITVEMWIGRMGGSSVEMNFEMVQNFPERLVFARATTTAVVVDGTTLTPVRLSDEARAAVKPWLGEPLTLSRR